MNSLFMITRDPFEPWKKAERVIVEAGRRGFETVIALDDATKPDQASRVRSMADVVIPWRSRGHCETAYRFVPMCSRKFVLLVSDDEEPSELLWVFAADPPAVLRFGIPVAPVLNGKLWKRDYGAQERVFPVKGWKWVKGFEGESVSPYGTAIIKPNPGILIWHYYLYAPREDREAKAARYNAIDPNPAHRERLIWEDHPEDLIDLPPVFAPHLPHD